VKRYASTVAFALGLSTALTAAAAAPAQLEKAVRDWQPDNPPREFSYALVHLKDAGPADALVLTRDPRYCGSGGCVLIVLEGELDGSFRLVSTSTVSRAPLYILPQRSHGWHDFTTFVSGGGTRACNAIMRFNGHRFPSNPSTVPCASQTELADAIAVKLGQ
jgi:hypothetical protein